MTCTEALRSGTRHFRFTEFGVGECHGKSVNSISRAAGKRGDCGGIEPTAQKHAYRHISDQVAANCGFEQRANARRSRLS